VAEPPVSAGIAADGPAAASPAPRPVPPPPGYGVTASGSASSPASRRNAHPAHVVDVEVTRVDEAEVEVRLADGRTGVVDRRDFADPPTVGSTVPAAVLSRDDDRRGRVALSHRWARTELAWQRVEKARSEHTALTGRVVREVKGGLVVDVGLRAFLPTSLIGEVEIPVEPAGGTAAGTATEVVGDTGGESATGDGGGSVDGEGRSEAEVTGPKTVMIADPSRLVGREVEVLVTEADRDRDRLVVSRRDLLRRRRRHEEKERFGSLKPGTRVTGRVVSVADYGAVVDLGGVRGLVHRSELSWERFATPADVMTVGEEVEVEVLDVNRSKKRVSLSRRNVVPDPYAGVEPGQIIPAVITRVVDYGAFARLESGAEGLIHMSELSEVPGYRPDQLVVPGEAITVKVMDVDRKRHRVGLSVRRVLVDD